MVKTFYFFILTFAFNTFVYGGGDGYNPRGPWAEQDKILMSYIVAVDPLIQNQSLEERLKVINPIKEEASGLILSNKENPQAWYLKALSLKALSSAYLNTALGEGGKREKANELIKESNDAFAKSLTLNKSVTLKQTDKLSDSNIETIILDGSSEVKVEGVKQLLEEYRNNPKDNKFYRYEYLIPSLMKLGRYDEAIIEIEHIKSIYPEEAKNAAEWELYIAEEKANVANSVAEIQNKNAEKEITRAIESQLVQEYQSPQKIEEVPKSIQTEKPSVSFKPEHLYILVGLVLLMGLGFGLSRLRKPSTSHSQ